MSEAKQSLINFLNQELSNLHVLYVKLHRYHWFVQGQHFFSLHQLFEELYTEVAEDLDVLAERILAIGGKPLATMAKFLDEATLEEVTADDKEVEMLKQLNHDFNKMIEELTGQGFKLTEEVNDEPTKDLLIGLQEKYEKHAWMLEATLAYG